MKKSKIKVEQITNQGEITTDFGEELTPTELANILTNVFPKSVAKDRKVYGEYYGNNYCVIFKNISYLGYPHPIHKKRYQIPSSFLTTYKENEKSGVISLLIGVYKYKDVVLFCDFNVDNYKHNKINNSSAHVYSIDLLNGFKKGFFKKRDLRGNDIIVFNENNIESYFNYKFNNNIDNSFEVFETVDEFFTSMSKVWFGMECYSEMLENHYHDSLQSEWAGSYLEFKFNEFLETNNKENIITFYQDKTKNGVDLDLYFPQLGMYGDLKAHSIDTAGIQGNDYETIMNILENQSIYYIVCNHTTEKDKDHGLKVTEFWNRKLNKTDLKSYGKKMKYKVSVKSYYILELNKYNKKYITMYNQGRNSDGKPRRPKIYITNRNIPNFLVHVLDFTDFEDKE